MMFWTFVYLAIVLIWFWIMWRGGDEWLADSYNIGHNQNPTNVGSELVPDQIRLVASAVLVVSSIWFFIALLAM